MSKDKLIPELRFPEFQDAGEWKKQKLSAFANRVTLKNNEGKVNKVFTNSAKDGIVEQSGFFDRQIVTKNNLTNYYIVEDGDYVYNPRISKSAPVGPISKNKTGLKGVMSPLYTVFRFKSEENDFFEYYFQSPHWFSEVKKAANTGARHDRISIKANDLFNIQVWNPIPREKDKITLCLASLDELISAHIDKLDTLKDQKSGLQQILFPHKDLEVPKLRFPEFQSSSNWERKRLAEVCSRIKRKNAENNENVLTISAQDGLVSQLEYFNKSVSAKDVSGYYLLKKGEFAYNKSYSKGYPMGAIKPLKRYPKGVVSTLYICFKANKKELGPFLEQYFESGMMNPEIGAVAQEGARNHGLLNIGVNDFFNTQLFIPRDTREQQKIASCLSAVDELISAQTEKIEQLQQHKKGMMQGLFPVIN